MRRKWVALDAMGVVFEEGDDTGELLVPYVKKAAPWAPEWRVRELYSLASLGAIAAPQFWLDLGLAAEFPRVDEEYLDTQFTPDPEFPAAARKLAQSFRIGMLSNDVAEWSGYLRRKHGIDGLFDVTVVSGRVGCRKPDAGIYRVFLKAAGASPGDCVLVDDSPANLRTALDLGMHAVLFCRGEKTGAFPHEVSGFGELAEALPRILPPTSAPPPGC